MLSHSTSQSLQYWEFVKKKPPAEHLTGSAYPFSGAPEITVVFSGVHMCVA